MSINLGGLSDLNTQISDAERMYFNMPSWMKSYINRTVSMPSDGRNADREKESLADAGTRGGKMFQEGRINALRQQRSNLNAGSPAQVPYEAFDPKNLSNTNNVMDDPSNISSALAQDSPNQNYFADVSQDPTGGLTDRMYLLNGRWVRGLFDANGVDVLHLNTTQPAVDTQAQAQLDAALNEETQARATMPEWLMGQYKGAATNAGTLSDTAQSQKALQDDFQAGYTGAMALSDERVNALRAARGLPPLPPGQPANIGLTPYGDTQAPINWTGQVSDSGGGWVGAGVGATAPPGVYSAKTTPIAETTAGTATTAPLVSSTPAQTESNDTGATAGKAAVDSEKDPSSTSPESQLSSASLQSGVKSLSNKNRLTALRMR